MFGISFLFLIFRDALLNVILDVAIIVLDKKSRNVELAQALVGVLLEVCHFPSITLVSSLDVDSIRNKKRKIVGGPF
jgi:hypothetical protein